MASSDQITNRGLWIESFSEPLKIVPLPVPSATTGSVVTQVLASPIPSYAHLVHNGTLKLPNFPCPVSPTPMASAEFTQSATTRYVSSPVTWSILILPSTGETSPMS